MQKLATNQQYLMLASVSNVGCDGGLHEVSFLGPTKPHLMPNYSLTKIVLCPPLEPRD